MGLTLEKAIESDAEVKGGRGFEQKTKKYF